MCTDCDLRYNVSWSLFAPACVFVCAHVRVRPCARAIIYIYIYIYIHIEMCVCVTAYIWHVQYAMYTQRIHFCKTRVMIWLVHTSDEMSHVVCYINSHWLLMTWYDEIWYMTCYDMVWCGMVTWYHTHIKQFYLWQPDTNFPVSVYTQQGAPAWGGSCGPVPGDPWAPLQRYPDDLLLPRIS